MTKKVNIRVPVSRDGTNRKNRSSSILSPDHARIEDRTNEDFLRLARDLSKSIRYYRSGHEDKVETWEPFFSEEAGSGQRHPPHFALFLAFLELLKYSADNLNTLTARHLDYFYQDVLRFKRNPEIPDRVNVVIQLTSGVDQYMLDEGTLFHAGKDILGKELTYKLIEKTTFNTAKVVALKSLYLQSEKESFELPEADHAQETDSTPNEPQLVWLDYLTGIKGKTITEKADEELLKLDPWPAMGTRDLPDVDVGLIIASPILLLREGERTIHLEFTSAYKGEELRLEQFKLNAEDFQVSLSTEDGWEEAELNEDEIQWSGGQDETNLVFGFSVTIPKEGPAIVPQVSGEQNQSVSVWPMIKIVLKPGTANRPYSVLRHLRLINTNIRAEVNEVKNLVLQNDKALLNPSKLFLPFGQEPDIGSGFYIGNPEIFQKQLDSLSIDLHWHGLPINHLEPPSDEQPPPPFNVSDLNKYYQEYPMTRNNDQFQVDIEILRKKSWVAIEDVVGEVKKEVSLFDTTDASKPKKIEFNLPKNNRKDEVFYSPLLHGHREPSLEELEPYTVNTKKDFLRMTLKNRDFGHKEYTHLYTQTIVKNSNLKKDETPDPLPNPPITPTLKSIAVNYTSQVNIDHSNKLDEIIHIHPFGFTPHDYFDDIPFLLPQYEGEGILYVGLKDVHPPQEVSILFQIMEGTSDPNTAFPDIRWSYLADNEWVSFKDTEILTDTTAGFNQPGIITFSIPEGITLNNSILAGDTFWIRAWTEKNTAGACKMAEIRAQVATLEFMDQDNAPEHLSRPLQPRGIGRLHFPDPSIQSVLQPYVSFQGKVKEQDHEFYQRVSERLRHKSRALTLWDFEHQILDQFSSLYKVKCFSHSAWESGYQPGSLLIIAISNVHNNHAVNRFKPLTSLRTLENIKNYAKKQATPYINVDVKNPYYEEIRVNFLVKFRDNSNTGYYKEQLQQGIKQFLSPWAFDKGRDISFGGSIYKSSLLDYIEEIPFVDVVTFFKMNHTDTHNNIRVNVEEAIASTPISILVSAQEHDIQVIQSDEELCADGIGHMTIEKTFTTIK